MLSDRDLFVLATESDLIDPFNPEYCEGATINLTLSPIAKQYTSNDPIVLGAEISENHYNPIQMMTLLDLYVSYNRITPEQYAELMDMVQAQ